MREKQQVHTFDIKEFVKAQKKKKLLEMMNAADNGSNPSGGNKDMFPGGFPSPGGARNPFAPASHGMMSGPRPNSMPGSMPNSFGNPFAGGPNPMTSSNSSNPFAPIGRPQQNHPVNDFPSMPGLPNGMMNQNQSHSNDRSPIPDIHSTPHSSPSVTPMNNSSKDDGLGFDVDELVRKIDAKIAELEEEEKRNNKEQAEKKNNSAKPASIPDATVISADKKATDLEPKIVEDVPTSVENPVITPISSHENSSERPEEKVEKKEIKEVETPNLVLDDDDDDDEFFDDFFDN